MKLIIFKYQYLKLHIFISTEKKSKKERTKCALSFLDFLQPTTVDSEALFF